MPARVWEARPWAQPQPEPFAVSLDGTTLTPSGTHRSGSNASAPRANHLIRFADSPSPAVPTPASLPPAGWGWGGALSHTPEPPGSPAGLFPVAWDLGRHRTAGLRVTSQRDRGHSGPSWEGDTDRAQLTLSGQPQGGGYVPPGPPIAATWAPADSVGASPCPQVRVAPGSSPSRYPGLPGGLAPRPAP